jgi:hypothetical protein
MSTPSVTYDLSIELVMSTGSSKNFSKKTTQKTRNKKGKEKNEYDILQIDNQIKLAFSLEKQLVPEHQKRILSIIKTLNSVKIPWGINDEIQTEITELKDNYKVKIEPISKKQIISITYKEYLDLYEQLHKLINRVNNIGSDALLNYYVYHSTPIIEEYKTILNTPIKRSFFSKGKVEEDVSQVRKKELLNQYLEIASQFVEIEYYQEETVEPKQSCDNCNNSNPNKFKISDGLRTCKECGFEVCLTSSMTSFKDMERINMHQKYKYEKISHFKEGVLQYQGKQNKVIDDYFYQKLEEWLKLHGLVNEKGKTKLEKYTNVKKEHLRIFISESDEKRITSHYEDLHLIYSELTSKPCADISHLEESLYAKFEKLVEAFLKLEYIQRINFLNTQFVLRKLLLMENYKVNKDDFPGLKTKEREREHEQLFALICGLAGLNNVPD